jgi:hypothetical protein
VRIVRIICSGLFAVLEEGDESKPYDHEDNNIRTFVRSVETVANNPHYAEAWNDFLRLFK